MSNKIYESIGSISDSNVDAKFKKCFTNHLVIYNESLEILQNSPEINFKSLTSKVYSYIRNNNITPYIKSALLNELYYQHKKFKRNIKIKKLLTDIQYLTFVSKDYTCKSIKFDLVNNCLVIPSVECDISLEDKLPELNSNELIYINISYSNINDKYKVTIYKM